MLNLEPNDSKQKSLIFLHIPKAAGSTLHKIIARQYASDSIYSIDGLRVHESIAEFKQLPEAKRSEIKVLKGHMRFGLHEYLPQPSTYITILRDPVERIISHYYYVLRSPEHYLYEQVTSRNMSLTDYICSGITKELNNSQTRLLCTKAALETYEQGSKEILESAKKNIQEKFAVVGLAEKFDETLILLKRNFKWNLPFYIKANITKDRPLKNDISQETLKIIEQYNELDVELYEFISKKFQKIITQSGALFEMELKQLQLVNTGYSTIRSFYRRILNKNN
jgi:hypothetical protein